MDTFSRNILLTIAIVCIFILAYTLIAGIVRYVQSFKVYKKIAVSGCILQLAMAMKKVNELKNDGKIDEKDFNFLFVSLTTIAYMLDKKTIEKASVAASIKNKEENDD